MKKVGFIGLGDMGGAMASNLCKEGFEVIGYDLREEQLARLEAAGGKRGASPADVGAQAEVVFIMVMTGAQTAAIVSGKDGLLETMGPGKTIILTATIQPSEAREIAKTVLEKGVDMIDSPVSGGKGGAEAGSLAMMAAGKRPVWEAQQDVMSAVGGNIFHVGDEIGMGQTVKASLQALIGATFTAIFESLVLGAKSGVKGQVLFDVFSASGVSSPLFKNCAELIMDRKFQGTGSQIKTMYKDLGITMGLARESGAAMFTTSAAYELFQSGISMFPDEDNWSIVKLLEQIADTEVKW